MLKFVVIGLALTAFIVKSDDGWNSDITIEVNLPLSDTDDTEIYVSTETSYGSDINIAEISISQDSYDYESGDFSYEAEEVVVEINTESGDKNSNEQTIVFSQVEESYETYTYSEVSVSNTKNDSSYDEYSQVYVAQQTTTEENVTYTTQVAESYSEVTETYNTYQYNNDTGYYEYTQVTETDVTENDYIVIKSATLEDENGTVYQVSETYGQVDEVAFNDTKVVVAENEGDSGSGVATEAWDWWVNDQQTVESSSSSFSLLQWIVVFVAVGVVAFFAYKKAAQMKLTRNNFCVSPVNSEATGYIRI